MELGTTELINRCKAGERQALHLLYQQYRPKLINVCKYYAKEDDVAEDLLHDAFVVILTSLEKLEKTDNLESWMTAIVKNVGYQYRQYVKKEQKALRQMAKENRPTTENKLNTEEKQTLDYDQLQALISQLPKGYQQVFRLSVFEELSHQEISQLLGIAPHSSSSQLSHAKRMLRLLIKQLWVLMLLLIAVPTAVWWFSRKQTPIKEQETNARETASKQEHSISMEIPEEHAVYTQVSSPSVPTIHPKSREHMSGGDTPQTINYPSETVVLSDSVPYLPTDSITVSQTEMVLSEEKETQMDSMTYHPTPWQPVKDQLASYPVKANRSWNVGLTYNGQVGQGLDFMAEATIGKNSFDAFSNISIPTGQTYNNWIDYSNYLNTNPSYDPETRSLMRIAAQNTYVNNGAMEARYEHRPPITLQLMLSRQISDKASIETGLSYTQLKSTITTGSTDANIQEKQKLRYVGIPLRFGWQWYKNSRFSLYSSAGPMLELPMRSTSKILHTVDGIYTFQKETSLNVPVQWSVSLGLGAQYNLTPHLGIYLEPSLQYFINNGSDLKTYRTEHPLEFTLPLGLRFHW